MSKVGEIYTTTDLARNSAVADILLPDGRLAKAQIILAVSAQVNLINRSGVIAVGGVSQEFMPANDARQGWIIQNYSTDPLYISGLGGAAADGNSLMIPGGIGQGYIAEFISGNVLTIFGPTTGQKYYAREWG